MGFHPKPHKGVTPLTPILGILVLSFATRKGYRLSTRNIYCNHKVAPLANVHKTAVAVQGEDFFEFLPQKRVKAILTYAELAFVAKNGKRPP